MKTDIKILRIMYVIIFISGFILYFHYANDKEVKVDEPDYKYEIRDIDEEKSGITYSVNINEKYSFDILTTISEQIRNDYNHIYNLEKTEDKAKYFDIFFYYDNEVYYVLTNDYVEKNKINSNSENETKEIEEEANK